jgi:hypothetical protein
MAVKRLRDVLILLAVAIAFGISLTLLGRVTGFTSPWFALTAMFCFLGVLRFAQPLFLLRLPCSLRQPQEWEVKGGLYRALGVPAFGELLRRTPLRHFQPLVYLSRYPGDPTKVLNQIESAEAAHFWGAALLVPYMIFVCVQNWWSVLIWLLVVQIIVNAYPILHLRWVRGRLKRVLDRKLLKHSTPNP